MKPSPNLVASFVPWRGLNRPLRKSITSETVRASDNERLTIKPSRFARHTIGSGDRRSSASIHTRANSDDVMDQSANFWRQLIVKSISAVFSWEFIVIAHLVLLSVVLLSGCSFHASAEIADQTFTVGTYLEKQEVNYE